MWIASSSAPARRIALLSLTLASFAAPVVAYFWFVDHFGLNTIWIDQWGDLGIISHTFSGHLTLSTLWAQHTQNRILFPNLIVLLLAYTTNFNVVNEDFLSATILVLSIALLIIGHRRRSPTTPWIVYSPVAILMLSVVQNGNTLWGFQFAWYLVLLALSVALVLCDSPKWKWFVTAAAISAAIVGRFSSSGSLDLASWTSHSSSQKSSETLRVQLDRRCGRDHHNLLRELQRTTGWHQWFRPPSSSRRCAVLPLIGWQCHRCTRQRVSLALGFLIVLTSLWLIVSPLSDVKMTTRHLWALH